MKRSILITRARLALLLAVFAAGPRLAQAQPHPPVEFGGPLFFYFPLLASYPPFQTDMPLDVFVGYAGLDSLARHGDPALVDKTLRNLTYADTARYAAKYLYEIVDYNPIKFFQWAYTNPSSEPYKNAPANLRKRFAARLDGIGPRGLNAIPLLMSDMIARIKVTSVMAQTDTTASMAKSAQLVTAYIIDTVKGHAIPACNTSYFKGAGERGAQSMLGACLQFDYRLEWPRLNHSGKLTYDDSTLVDGSGQPWVKSNAEYIVFLMFGNLRHDDAYNYAALTPVVGWGTSVCLYPVIDGHVYDPYDDFGYGTGLTVEQFTAALRNNINVLTHP